MTVAGNEDHGCLTLALERFLGRPDEEKLALSFGKLSYEMFREDLVMKEFKCYLVHQQGNQNGLDRLRIAYLDDSC
jgi:hypothetical protein